MALFEGSLLWASLEQPSPARPELHEALRVLGEVLGRRHVEEPALHLLREASIDRAVAAFPDPERIYERNIETVRRLGPEGWRKLLQDDPAQD